MATIFMARIYFFLVKSGKYYNITYKKYIHPNLIT
jgi:hypothetical protein